MKAYSGEELNEMIQQDKDAGPQRTDRSRFLAANAALVLAERQYEQFAQLELTLPFEESLARKQASMDETMAVHDGDVVCVPRGHHPCGAPYGFDMYYLNVMAGPLRKWRFVPAPEVEWIMERDG